MAAGSPQIQDGYTKFANELLDAVIRFPWASPKQTQVVLWVARNSYGWGKTRLVVKASLTKLEGETGISRSTLSWVRRTLVDAGVLFEDYSLNKHYNEWIKPHGHTLPLRHARKAPPEPVKQIILPGAFAYPNFPVVGKGSGVWILPPEKPTEWAASYPGVAVDTHLRRAWQWCQDNPTKRKTASHMLSFLNRWLADEQNKADKNGAGALPQPAPKQPSKRADAAPEPPAAPQPCGLCERLLEPDDSSVCKDCGHFCRKCDKQTNMLTVRFRADKTKTALCGRCSLKK